MSTKVICLKVTRRRNSYYQYGEQGNDPPVAEYYAPTATMFSTSAKSVPTLRYLCYTMLLEWAAAPPRAMPPDDFLPGAPLPQAQWGEPSGSRDILASSDSSPPNSHSSSPSPPPPVNLAFSYWWKVGGHTNDRHAEPIAIATGEHVAAYLCSPRYDPTKAFNGKHSSCYCGT